MHNKKEECFCINDELCWRKTSIIGNIKKKNCYTIIITKYVALAKKKTLSALI